MSDPDIPNALNNLAHLIDRAVGRQRLQNHPTFCDWLRGHDIQTDDAGDWPARDVTARDLRVTIAWDDADQPYIEEAQEPLEVLGYGGLVQMPAQAMALIYGVTCAAPGASVEIVRDDVVRCSLTGDLEHGRTIRGLVFRDLVAQQIAVSPRQPRPVQVILHALVTRRW